MRNKTLYYLFSKDGSKPIDSAYGGYQLAKILGRDFNSVSNTLWRIKKGKLKHIRDVNGNIYTLETADTIIQSEDNKCKKKKNYTENCMK